MCTVSNIGDIYGETFPQRWPRWVPDEPLPNTTPFNLADLVKLLKPPADVSREEFDALKCELQEIKQLLLAAKKFDEATGQKDCEMADKIVLFKRLAELLGVDFSEVFTK